MGDFEFKGSSESTSWDNTDSDYIELKEANLRNVLNTHYNDIENYCTSKGNWLAPFGIFFTLLITLATADFKNISTYMSTEMVKGMIFTLAVFAAAWFIATIVFNKSKKNNFKKINELVDEIKGKK